MENHTLKSVAFGGFDKQDVASYIEHLSKDYEGRLSRLEQEREALRQRAEAAESQASRLREQAEAQSAEAETLRSSLEQAERRAAALQDQQARLQELTAQVEELRPDAQAYRQFRNRIGDIECEARSRAAELDADTRAGLQKTAEQFRRQYEALSASFDTASAYVTEELRKVQVNLAQLPRALDQIGTDLDRLDAALKDGGQ